MSETHSTPLNRDERAILVLDDLSRGLRYRDISEKHGMPISTIATIAKRYSQLEADALARMMQSRALAMLEHWEDAAETGAKLGKHAPAKDWLLHAKLLTPIDTEAKAPRIAILIGQPGAPLDAIDVQVMKSQRVTSDTDGTE